MPNSWSGPSFHGPEDRHSHHILRAPDRITERDSGVQREAAVVGEAIRLPTLEQPGCLTVRAEDVRVRVDVPAVVVRVGIAHPVAALQEADEQRVDMGHLAGHHPYVVVQTVVVGAKQRLDLVVRLAQDDRGFRVHPQRDSLVSLHNAGRPTNPKQLIDPSTMPPGRADCHHQRAIRTDKCSRGWWVRVSRVALPSLGRHSRPPPATSSGRLSCRPRVDRSHSPCEIGDPPTDPVGVPPLHPVTTPCHRFRIVTIARRMRLLCPQSHPGG